MNCTLSQLKNSKNYYRLQENTILGMRFSEAFRETLFRYGISGKCLAEKSGVSERQISKFRNGDNLRTDTLEKLLEALPENAREYMMLLVLRRRDMDHVPLPKQLSGDREQGTVTSEQGTGNREQSPVNREQSPVNSHQ
jgi:DNA-binding Xre family transcriptional regulator